MAILAALRNPDFVPKEVKSLPEKSASSNGKSDSAIKGTLPANNKTERPVEDKKSEFFNIVCPRKDTGFKLEIAEDKVACDKNYCEDKVIFGSKTGTGVIECCHPLTDDLQHRIQKQIDIEEKL